MAVATAGMALARAAEAQSVGARFVDDWKYAAKDVLGVWGSPFRASGQDWLLVGVRRNAAAGASSLYLTPGTGGVTLGTNWTF